MKTIRQINFSFYIEVAGRLAIDCTTPGDIGFSLAGRPCPTFCGVHFRPMFTTDYSDYLEIFSRFSTCYVTFSLFRCLLWLVLLNGVPRNLPWMSEAPPHCLFYLWWEVWRSQRFLCSVQQWTRCHFASSLSCVFRRHAVHIVVQKTFGILGKRWMENMEMYLIGTVSVRPLLTELAQNRAHWRVRFGLAVLNIRDILAASWLVTFPVT